MNRTHHQRRGFTLVELLVVISIIAIIAGLVVPVLLRGREEAWKVQCTSNLKQIYTAAADYSNKKYSFPLARSGQGEPRAHESLNKLLESRHGKGLEAAHFKCPTGDAVVAEEGEDGRFVLTEDTLDYTWTAGTAKANRMAPLASDKHMAGPDRGGHQDVLMVLFTDSSVQEMEADKLDPETGLPEGLGR